METINNSDIKPIFPIDGDVLHKNDGNMTAEGLNIVCSFKAPARCTIKVNGETARENTDGTYLADVRINKYQNILRIENQTTNDWIELNVYFAENFAGKYRLSIDDNIRFLQDIALNAENYNSIFENPYLGKLKSIHETYGTKVHFNLFYESEQGDFNLSQMPDKFKAEWKAQRHWMRLSFHAYREFPDEPYLHADYETVRKDCELIQNEIKRFAGEELLGPVTTVHWGAVNVHGARAMRDCGYKGQLGYFNVDDSQYPVSYYLNEDERRHMKKRFIWKDEREGIIFIRSSIVVDATGKNDMIPKLESYREQRGNLPPYVDFLVHEQYYYPDYFNYQPDYFEKLEMLVEWVKDNGYEPAFLEECIFQ